jgi:hypothetical protein
MVNVEDLSRLMELDYGHYDIIENVRLLRVTSQHFAYCFNVLYDTDEDRREVAQLRFCRYGEKETDMIYTFLHISNSVLYDCELFDMVMKLPENLGMVFHNITAIDLAKDFTNINPVSVIRKMYKDKDITTIINGKAVRDRKQTIIGLSQTYSISLDRLKNPTISVKQVKALHNKAKGITVCAYNKHAEIEESEKDYILNYYDNPKKLHRLEVHLNSQEVTDYFKHLGKIQDLTLLVDSNFRDDMYFYHLSSVIRFSKGRNPLPWSDLLQCTGRVR